MKKMEELMATLKLEELMAKRDNEKIKKTILCIVKVIAVIALIAGIAGLLTSYYVGSSAGASITLYLAAWFLITFLLRKKRL